LVAIAAWRVLLNQPDRPDAPGQAASAVPGQPAAANTDAGAVIAFVLSPVASRSAADAAPLVIPPGVSRVALRLAGDPGSSPLRAPQVTIRTVEGRDVFRGMGRPSSGSALAEVDVPAAILTPDDYVVQLDELRDGVAEERLRYFLSVRTR
jgi:hypothetical protein